MIFMPKNWLKLVIFYVFQTIEAARGYATLNMYNIYSNCYTPVNSIGNEIWSLIGVLSNYEKLLIIRGWDEQIWKLRQQYK